MAGCLDQIKVEMCGSVVKVARPCSGRPTYTLAPAWGIDESFPLVVAAHTNYSFDYTYHVLIPEPYELVNLRLDVYYNEVVCGALCYDLIYLQGSCPQEYVGNTFFSYLGVNTADGGVCSISLVCIRAGPTCVQDDPFDCVTARGIYYFGDHCGEFVGDECPNVCDFKKR